LVDQRAIGTDQMIKFLLTVNKQNVVERRDVKLGCLQDDLRVIQSGIGPDDLVIVNGLQRARPGAAVTPHFDGQKDIAVSSSSGETAKLPSGGATTN
jgi:hypothetical protein